MSRNNICSCGSGRKFKYCCGALGQGADVDLLKHEALAMLKRGDYSNARINFETVLRKFPQDADSVHMLSVAMFYQGDIDGAIRLVTRALDMTNWNFSDFKKNLGIFLAEKLKKCQVISRNDGLVDEYREWLRNRKSISINSEPLVSVLMPAYNHQRYVERALESVFDQSYKNIELIVIDDGSKDETRSVIQDALKKCPFKHVFISRENKGSVATLHECLSLSHGEFINVLHSDDFYHRERIQVMVDSVARAGMDWGFSNVSFVGADGESLDQVHKGAMHLRNELDNIEALPTVGLSLITTNVSITTGNIFVRRNFFDRVGLNLYKYNDDWDFCLRATRESEPVYVNERLFYYRYHGLNTITSSGDGPRLEANDILSKYLRESMSDVIWNNRFSPSYQTWGDDFLYRVLAKGLGLVVEDEVLKMMVAKLNFSSSQ